MQRKSSFSEGNSSSEKRSPRRTLHEPNAKKKVTPRKAKSYRSRREGHRSSIGQNYLRRRSSYTGKQPVSAEQAASITCPDHSESKHLTVSPRPPQSLQSNTSRNRRSIVEDELSSSTSSSGSRTYRTKGKPKRIRTRPVSEPVKSGHEELDVSQDVSQDTETAVPPGERAVPLCSTPSTSRQTSITQVSDFSMRTQDESSAHSSKGLVVQEVPYGVAETESQKRIKEFVNYCLRTPLKEIVAQFEEVRNITPKKADSFIGRLPLNQLKSRYYDIYCLDATRVRLKNPQNDYIHANHIRHKVLQNEFILTQGPLENTIVDFWEMVWEQKAAIIFMLCKTVEEKLEKCAQYWPTGAARIKKFEQFQIELKERSVNRRRSLIRSQILLRRQSSSHTLTVIHYQWTGWPDFKVPDEDYKTPFFLLQKSRISPTPTVVHCSAGVGRSGTLVALEMCLMQLIYGKKLNVPSLIKYLRQMRAHCVQNKQQFLFIHRALLSFATVNAVVSNAKVRPFVEAYNQFIRSI